MNVSGITWSEGWLEVGKIGVAYLLALPMGLERERTEHSIGLRTFPLVAVASCAYLLLSPMGSTADRSRIIQGLVAGIGFIGGGAILKGQEGVHGTATAAAIWNTGAIGAAVAQGQYHVAILLSAINLVTFRFLMPLKQRLDSNGGLKSK